MLTALGVTAPFFALIFCGWLARAKGVMRDGAQAALNQFVLYFALPALLIRTLGAVPLAEMVRPDFLGAWALAGALMLVSGWAAARLVFRQPGKAAVIQGFAASHGNVGYMGITLVIGLLGPAAAAPVAMAITVDMLLLIPVVIAAMSWIDRPEGATGGAGQALATAARAAVANPFVLSIVAGLALSASGATLPGVLDDFLRVLGQAAVPAALFAIGLTLYGQPLRGAASELGALCLLKLLVHPVAAALIASRVFGLGPELTTAAALLAALPVANNVFVVATRHEARPGLVSGAILISTAAALVSFNLWAALALR